MKQTPEQWFSSLDDETKRKYKIKYNVVEITKFKLHKMFNKESKN